MKILLCFSLCLATVFCMPPDIERTKEVDLPKRVLENPASIFRSDNVRGLLADDNERFAIDDRAVRFFIPDTERFRSRLTERAYTNQDEQVNYDSYRSALRDDRVKDSDIRQLKVNNRYQDKDDGQVYHDQLRGDHVIDPTGNRHDGELLRNLRFQNGEFRGDLNRDLVYRNQGEGFVTNDDGHALPNINFFQRGGRFAARKDGTTEAPPTDAFAAIAAAGIIPRPINPFAPPQADKAGRQAEFILPYGFATP